MNLLLRLAIPFVTAALAATAALAQPLAPVGASGNTTPVPAATRETIVDNLQKSRPNLTFDGITATPIAGMYAVKVTNGPTLYTTEDGRYFVLGDLFEVTDQGYVNIAEQQREQGRAARLAQLSEEEMIVFSPEEGSTKASVMVFTDVDCFYCQKLHREVPDLNRIGIEVRYLAFPRAGIGSESYRKIASAWCADDPQTAITKLKNRQNIPIDVCAGNPVEAQYKLGQEVGVTGTPALLTESGRLMPGYMPALQLANALGVEVDPEIAEELAKEQAAQK